MPLLLIGLGAGVHSADSQQLRGVPASMLLNSTVLQRASDELRIAESARMQATATSKAVRVEQQNYASHVPITRATEDYDRVKAVVPEAKAAALTARMYAAQARQHADHTKEVELETRHIPEFAAERSKEAVEGWISAEARQAAAASAISPKEAAKAKRDKVAAGVAAAAEPYHLALLRSQKFVAQTYSKAKTAQQSSLELQEKAKKIAVTAQELQASGLGVDAQAAMGTAHSMMNEAENLRQWAVKLYKQANTADSSAGAYTVSEQQAAVNAAATMVINAPMKLPPSSL